MIVAELLDKLSRLLGVCDGKISFDVDEVILSISPLGSLVFGVYW